MTRTVVVGGDAGGMSAASQARRRLADAEVIALERGEHVSYSSCSMPHDVERPHGFCDPILIAASVARKEVAKAARRR